MNNSNDNNDGSCYKARGASDTQGLFHVELESSRRSTLETVEEQGPSCSVPGVEMAGRGLEHSCSWPEA